MKIPLPNLTFNIPVRIDSADREQNLDYTVEYLLRNFDCNIVVYENGPMPIYKNKNKVKHIFEQNNGPFHRTKYLNILARCSNTKLIANHDCDVLLDTSQISKAYFILQTGGADYVHPYDGYFVNIPRRVLNVRMQNYNIPGINVAEHTNLGKGNLGGSVFWSKQVFFECGGENEKFVSWGFEDWERYVRVTKLGYNVARAPGPLFHMDHPRGPESGDTNPFYQDNSKEYDSIKNMTPDEIRQYIKTWAWRYI